jgi:predicted O-linked N-acetylglucosamine transferase (SPINDLY family)
MNPDPAKVLEEAIGLAQRGALADAERVLRDLLTANPEFARAHNVLGVVEMQQGRHPEAEASLLRAARLAPEDARPHVNLGSLYGVLRRPADAEKHLREAIGLDPGNVGAHFNLAAILQAEGRIDDAEGAYERAIDLAPTDAEAHYRLAGLRLLKYRFAEAEAGLKEAIRLRPDFGVAHGDLALIFLETGRCAEAQASSLEAARLNPHHLVAWSNHVMAAQYDPDATDEALLAHARQAGQAMQAAAARMPAWQAPPAARAAAAPRIGIVSADLHRHPVGLLLWPVLRELQRSGVAVSLYSNGNVVDDVSQELQRLGQWTSIKDQSDDDVCKRIRDNRPDVLIDLAGHTGSNRLAVFAARAAPVQLSWLGYFATTGTPNMDFVLMDPWHAPAGCENQFTEQVLRMPHTRFCFQPVAGAPPVAPQPPSAARRHVTFGCFNNVAKINDRVIAAWSRVLKGVPGSKLALKWRTFADASFRIAFAARLKRAGIGPERIELRRAGDYPAMLAEYGDIDIALDTFPFTGGQTSFDATWMGVPVVTLAGHRPVGRQTLSILGNLGMEDLAADSEDAYVVRAVALANDPARLADYRASIRDRMRASPLMQAPEFADAFLALLRGASGPV